VSGWIDAHVHLDAAAFDVDRDAVVARAIQAGVGLMVSAGTSAESSERAVVLAERYPSVVAAVGIHPEGAEGVTAGTVKAVAAMARHPRVVAIGEVGLDYYRNSVPRNAQIEVFRALLRLAREVNLPVIVHDRDAHEDVERILVEEGVSRVVLHCFGGTLERALRCTAAGWTLSFAGPLTFPKSAELRDVAKAVPLDRVLVETDAPYLAPQPMRGRRCEPVFLLHTARVLADLRQMEETALAAALAQNARRVFALTGEE